tara:strand:+ start:162 stop:860 length:699 start_codon:yes stop_codon:yes gene_type:complete
LKKLIKYLSHIFYTHTIEKILAYRFKNKNYLEQALTHKSTNSHARKNYERLEFLGDAVIDIIISKLLIKEFPMGDEGLLTQKRSGLVQKEFLGSMGEKLNLISYLQIDSTVNISNKKVRYRLEANMLEALIGAIYLDGGLKPCHKIIYKNIWNHRLEAWKTINYKGKLIEYCHSGSLDNPIFLVSNIKGPEHKKTFEVQVKIKDRNFPPGFGSNKKAAEQKAAQKALVALRV